jgi:hypothetical protein
MPQNASVAPGGFSAGFVLKYLLGAIIVVGGLVASVVYAGHQLSDLRTLVTVENAAACHSGVHPACLGEYQATTVQEVSSSDSGTTVLLRSPFSAATDGRDECFGTSCLNYVRIPAKDAALLRYPEMARISAVDGRVVRIAAQGADFTTLDAPGATMLDNIADLLSALYLLTVCALFAGAYVVLAIGTGIWRIHPVRWIRAVTLTEVISGALSALSFAAYAVRGFAGVAIAAVVFLGGFIVSLVVRFGHKPDVAATTSAPTAREAAYGPRHYHPLQTALYTLIAFPAWLGITVGLQLINDGYGTRAIIAFAVGLVFAAFLVYKAHAKMATQRPRIASAR